MKPLFLLVALALGTQSARVPREQPVLVDAEGGEGDTSEVKVVTVETLDGEPVQTDPTTTTTTHAPREDGCMPFRYCNSIKFEKRVKVKDRAVQCDMAPNPKERCCLPQKKHFVCYNIMVEGQYLNYDQNDVSRSTDFAQLCAAMAGTYGNTTGVISAASTSRDRGGMMTYRYDRWFELEDQGTVSLKDIACEIAEEED